MAKNVALSKDAYEILDRLKRPNESFSDVVKRLGNRTPMPDWREAIGLWKDDKEFDKIFDEIIRSRLLSKRRVIKW